MKFIRQGNWYELSECTKYAVCAAKVGGAFVFTATYLPTDINKQEILHVSPDVKDCRQACVDHEREHNGRKDT